MFPGVSSNHEGGEIALAKEAGPGPGTEIWLRTVEDIRGMLPEEVWKVMSPEFYLTFWSLSYGDIFVPSSRCVLLCHHQACLDDTCRAASRGCSTSPEVC